MIRPGGTYALLLDFDGTLAEFRPMSEQAQCPAETRRLLARLSRRPNVHVGVISGRRLGPLRQLVGVAGLAYAGVCGGETNGRLPAIRKETRDALERVRTALEEDVRCVAGIQVEDKGVAFAVHFRGARAPAVRRAHAALRRALAGAGGKLRVLQGTHTWEVLPEEIKGKGEAVRAAMRRLPASAVGIYIGDDAADEPAFAALPRGITVRVGRAGKTAARYWVRGPGEVFELLTRIEEALQ